MNFINSESLKNKASKISLWEKVRLFFIRRQYYRDDWENTVTTYKVMKGKIYVLAVAIVPPMGWNCRCVIIPKRDPRCN